MLKKHRAFSKISFEMDRKTAKVVRCKSSNTAIVTRNKKKYNKKSVSSGEFDTPRYKKRGVYVEKKTSRLNSPDKMHPKKEIKAPRRPPPGKKRFLASVLTILSKSTAATQYPASNDDLNNPGKKDEGAKRTRIKNKSTKIEDKIPFNAETTSLTKVKKSKFKSKILNETMNINTENVQMITLLQSNGGVMTPSNYSGRSRDFTGVNESSEYAIIEFEDKALKNTLHNNITGDLVKEVLEGKSQRKAKLRALEQEPTTLIGVEETENQKYIYNFFVDLLKTTMSVNKLKPPQDTAAEVESANTSKVNLHMDASIAKRLNVHEKAFEINESISQRPSRQFFSINDECKHWRDQGLFEQFPYSPPKLPPQSTRRKTRSAHNSKKNTILHETELMAQKGSFYGNKKKNLLKLFKDELRMDDGIYEEPQNFYEALKFIARSKRHKQAINFKESIKKPENDKPCRYKFREVLSSRKNYKPTSKFFKSHVGYLATPTRSEINNYSKNTSTVTTYNKNETYPNDDPSYHSLEVHGYDYVDSVQRIPLRPNEISLPYHSSMSESDLSEF